MPATKAATRRRLLIFLAALVALAIMAGTLPLLGFWQGGHDSIGASPQTTWYFAEGTTRAGFEEYVCLLNPGSTATTAKFTYVLGTGDKVERSYTIEANKRATVSVGAEIPPENDVAIVIDATQPIVAERPMYFRYKGAWAGGHDVMGAALPGTSWYFAEGTTRAGFEEYVCLLNPGSTATTAKFTYVLGTGDKVERSYTIEANKRATVSVGAEIPPENDVAIVIDATQPIVAERPMYFAYRSLRPEWMTIDRNAIAASLGWGEIYRGDTTQRRVALTFDVEARDGAIVILDILKSYGLRCTFFVLGGFADSNPDIVQRLAAEGHELANHSWSHYQFSKLSADQIRSELARTEELVQRLTGFTTQPYFRYPYGDRTSADTQVVNGEGYLSVYWTVDPQDWRGIRASELYSRVVSQTRPGSIVLMHTILPDQKAGALPAIINDLQASGYELVTLTELLFHEP